MLNWKYLTSEANKAYSNDAFFDAIELNQQALMQAEISFNSQFEKDPESAVAAMIVSILNLADSFTAVGDFNATGIEYQKAINFLQTTIIRPDINEQKKDLILRTANQVRLEWEGFNKRYKQSVSLQIRTLMKDISNAVYCPQIMVHH